MVIVHNDITFFFEKIFEDLDCQPDTRAYIVSIYAKYKNSKHDLSKDSITLIFMQARIKHNFSSYQNLGDLIFFSNTIAPSHLKNASKDYYDTIGRLSYLSCYNLINRKWKLFEEISDNFIILENQVKNRLNKNILF